MSTPIVITTAITGAVPRKKDNPAVPVTPAEQIESTHEAYEAGAALVHIHVRNEDESSVLRPGAVRARAGGREEALPRHDHPVLDRRPRARAGGARRDASTSSPTWPRSPPARSTSRPTIYENPPDFVEGLASTMLEHDIKPEIEVFDLAMLYNAANLVKRGLLKEPLHVQFVMGITNAMPARRTLLEFLRRRAEGDRARRHLDGGGHGRIQFEVNKWCAELGGHCRTGLEDNLSSARTGSRPAMPSWSSSPSRPPAPRPPPRHAGRGAADPRTAGSRLIRPKPSRSHSCEDDSGQLVGRAQHG